MTPTIAISEEGYKVVSQYILDRLPSDARGFRASLGYHVLSGLSQSLSASRIFLTKSLNILMTIDAISNKHLHFKRSFKLLLERYLDKAKVEGKAKKKNMQRGRTSRFKVKSGAHVEINVRLLRALGHEAPKDRDSAEEMIRSIIATQRDSLEVRLSHVPPTLTLLGRSLNVC